MKVLKIYSNDEDPYLNRIKSLEKIIREDATYMIPILKMLIEYCNEFSAEAYYVLPKIEDHLEIALFRTKEWLDEIEALEDASGDEHEGSVEDE